MHAYAVFLGTWVMVMNPEGIMNYNTYFRFGATCVLGAIQAVEVVHSLGEQTLYRSTHRSPAGGTECPHGTYFVTTAQDLHTPQLPPRLTKEALDQLHAHMEGLLRPRR